MSSQSSDEKTVELLTNTDLKINPSFVGCLIGSVDLAGYFTIVQTIDKMDMTLIKVPSLLINDVFILVRLFLILL